VTIVDYVPHFHREIRAFQAAARRAVGEAESPLVPSCPGWSASDLILHLGGVHRGVSSIIRDRLTGPPDFAALVTSEFPADLAGWPAPERAPNRGPVPESLVDWFAEGAGRLGTLFAERDRDQPAWTWGPEQTVGFWLRMQTIEAAVHRWDAESALAAGPATVPGTETAAGRPLDAELAADAIGQTLEVMAPARRAWTNAPAGAGERFRFRQTDGGGVWTVRFDGADVRVTGGADEPCDLEVTGTASDVALFLWQRLPADRLEVTGDPALIERYFVLVPPV
jgi:uncharacterized protein (TIGR03083 family)